MMKQKLITAAIVGSTEHGKTTLVRCLGRTARDSCQQSTSGEVQPTMSFTPLPRASSLRLALVEMPNHNDMQRSTAWTLNRFDLAILVVAADDGVVPWTKDQLEALKRFQVQGGLAVISKADLVDYETIQLARMEIKDVSVGSCLEGQPIIPFSRTDLRGLDEIRAAVKEQANRINGCSYYSTSHYKALKKQVLATVVAHLVRNVFKIAVRADELLSEIELDCDDALLQRILGELRSERKLVEIDRGFRVPSLSLKLPVNAAKSADQMLDYARSLGCITFNARTLCELHWKTFKVNEIRGLLEYLRAKRKLVRLSDGRYLTSEAMEEIKQRVTDLITRKGSLRVQDSWKILGYGRNRAIPVLDYLDFIGLTRRINDVRVLR